MWPDKCLTIINIPFVTSSRVEGAVTNPCEVLRPRSTKRERALNGAENISLFRTTIGVKIRLAWKDNGRGLLVMPLGPRQFFLEMRLNSRTDTWSFCVAEHVDKI